MTTKKIETALELGNLHFKPAKVKEATDGKLVRTGPHVLEIPLSLIGRADVLADYLGTLGAEKVAVKIKPAAGGIKPWEGFGTLGPRSIKPSAEDGVISISFKLRIEGEVPAKDLLPLIKLRLSMAAEDISSATCSFAPTQEELEFGK